MKILIFGGSGIISTEICKFALDKGNSVTIFNRGKRREQIHPEAKLIIGDMRKEEVSVIQKKLDEYYDIVLDCISYNTEQLDKTLNAVKNRCTQFMFISSATVYTSQKNHIYNEDSAISGCDWKYAQDKADCEAFIQKKNIPCQFTIIRPYITYGETRIPYQIAPLEYYTIVNRIKCHKPIMICGKDTLCTLTDARDFAVGAYGLMLNSAAYGEAVHITGEYRTTWGDVIQIISETIGETVQLIDVPVKFLIKNKNTAGFDVDEILGDKGRNMIFDNTKIKHFVPEFSGIRSFNNSVKRTMQYFEAPEHKIINYYWDACIDRLLEGYLKANRIEYDKNMLSVKAYGDSISKDDYRIYQGNRTTTAQIIFKVRKKIERLFKAKG